MISTWTYAVLRGKIDRYEKKRIEMYGEKKRSFTPEEIDAISDRVTADIGENSLVFSHPYPTNEERSAVEVYELANSDPVKYHCYLGRTGDSVTTWTGEKIGTIVHEGKTWRDSFGGLRMSVRVRLCNGRMYSGFVNGYDGVNLKIMKDDKEKKS